MFKYILGAVAFAVAILGVEVRTAAADELYGKFTIGQAVNTEAAGVDLSDDLAYGVAVGGRLGPARIELGVSRIGADTAGISISAIDYSATAFLDLPVSERGAFFAGVGLDYLTAEAGVAFFTVDGEGDGWHYTGGYAHRFTNDLTVEIGVNHLEADLDFSGYSIETSTDVAYVGARFAL